MFFVENDVGIFPYDRFQNLIAREEVIKSHKGHGVLNAGIVSVESDNVFHAHDFQFSQHNGAIERFPCVSSVLTSAVKKRHNDCDARRFAADRRNKSFQILEMVVGTHTLHLSEHFVLHAVVTGVDNDVQVFAAYAVKNHCLAVARRKTREVGGDDKRCGGFLCTFSAIPVNKVFIDFFGEFFRAG